MTTQTNTRSPYLECWEGCDWTRVQTSFQMDEAEPEEVIFARYDRDMTDGRAQILYRNGSRYFYVSGSHCSCHGLEDQWSPEEYTLDTLIAAIERAKDAHMGFCSAGGDILLPMLGQRLRRRGARERRRLRDAA